MRNLIGLFHSHHQNKKTNIVFWHLEHLRYELLSVSLNEYERKKLRYSERDICLRKANTDDEKLYIFLIIMNKMKQQFERLWIKYFDVFVLHPKKHNMKTIHSEARKEQDMLTKWICDVCWKELAITQPRDFWYLSKSNQDPKRIPPKLHPTFTSF